VAIITCYNEVQWRIRGTEGGSIIVTNVEDCVENWDHCIAMSALTIYVLSVCQRLRENWLLM